MTAPESPDQIRYWESFGQRRSPDHPAVQAFAAPKVAFVRDTLPNSVESLLEVGSGNGYLSTQLAKHYRTVCVDFALNMLRMHPYPARWKIQARAETLPLADSSFDAVLCANLLHHLDSPIAAVREMARVARSHVVVIEPNACSPPMFLFSLFKKEERGGMKFLPRYVRSLGKKCDLVLVAFTKQGWVLPNRTPPAVVPYLSRLESFSSTGFYSIAIFAKQRT